MTRLHRVNWCKLHTCYEYTWQVYREQHHSATVPDIFHFVPRPKCLAPRFFVNIINTIRRRFG